MTSMAFGGRGSESFERDCWKRKICSWVTGSDGERSWEAIRVRRASRNFSGSLLVDATDEILVTKRTLTSPDEDLETHLLRLDILWAVLKKSRNKLHSFYQRLRSLQ